MSQFGSQEQSAPATDAATLQSMLADPMWVAMLTGFVNGLKLEEKLPVFYQGPSSASAASAAASAAPAPAPAPHPDARAIGADEDNASVIGADDDNASVIGTDDEDVIGTDDNDVPYDGPMVVEVAVGLTHADDDPRDIITYEHLSNKISRLEDSHRQHSATLDWMVKNSPVSTTDLAAHVKKLESQIDKLKAACEVMVELMNETRK